MISRACACGVLLVQGRGRERQAHAQTRLPQCQASTEVFGSWPKPGKVFLGKISSHAARLSQHLSSSHARGSTCPDGAHTSACNITGAQHSCAHSHMDLLL